VSNTILEKEFVLFYLKDIVNLMVHTLFLKKRRRLDNLAQSSLEGPSFLKLIGTMAVMPIFVFILFQTFGSRELVSHG
ncbi:MAG: hypothetical protein L6N94_04655, partial [Candidatus Methylarchaceae archaeon HK01M]|nr:hypothetical protein [Candidatus Methylarchaceae archaeon HK01M]